MSSARSHDQSPARQSGGVAGLRLALCLVLTLGLWIGPSSLAAAGDATDDEIRADRIAHDLFERLNDERAARDLPPVTWDTETARYATDRAQQRADAGEATHEPSPDSRTWMREHRWKAFGENFLSRARPGEREQLSAGAAHVAFMTDEDRRDLLLAPRWTHGGIGVVCHADELWVSQAFVHEQQERGPVPETEPEPFVHRDGDGPTCADPIDEPDDERPFNDVPRSHPHADAIEALDEAGVTSGCDERRYCPSRIVTRGQMATFLAAVLDLPPAEDQGFTDTADSPHRDNIDRLAGADIASGFSDGTFRPTAEVTRGQMTTFLARGLDLPPAEDQGFTDTADSAHRDNIDRLAGADIASGFSDGTFRPSVGVNRGQMATFLQQAREHLADDEDDA